jgi:hypothetical protein
MQVSAYKEALKEMSAMDDVLAQITFANIQSMKLAIVQLGYRRNKKRYKFTEIENKFDLFLAAKRFWQNEHGDEKPPFPHRLF